MAYEIKAVPADPYNGSPIIPTGDPMKDGIGPAAWAERHDEPDRTVFGDPKIVPMRVTKGFWLNPRDPNPIGMPVIAADKQVAGTVVEVWVDRSEPQVRYYEVQLAGSEERRLLPAPFVQWPNFGLWGCDRLLVKSITSRHFPGIPQTRSMEQITLLEEDKIVAYYGGGHMYALPGRGDPVI
jgi:photosynthetic reaction center H subunit